MLNLEVDGKPVQVPNGSTVMDAAHQARPLRPAFLLAQEAHDRGELPHVPGAGGEGAEADAGVRHAGDRGHEGVDALRSRRHGAKGRDGVPADQSSARLPDLRPGRRMPAAGPRRRLRRVEFPLQRTEARRPEQEPRTADLHRHDALHPLHALCPLRAGNRGHHGTRHGQPRRARRDHDLRRQDGRFGAVGQHDRPVPGRCADVEAVSLLGAHLGAGAAQVGFAARRARQQPYRAGQERPRHARGAARKRGGQRMLALRQGSFFVRGAQFRGSPDAAADRERRRAGRHRLADRARARRRRARSASSRQHGAGAIGVLASPHATLEELHLAQKLVRGLGSDNIDFRLRQTDFTASAHTVARHADRRIRARSTARWSSAVSCARIIRCSRSGCARRRKRASAAVDRAFRARRAADAASRTRVIVAPSALPRALAEIVAAAATASGKPVPEALCGRRAFGRCEGHRGQPSKRRTQGHLSRQFRAAASARLAAACARAGTGRVDRRAPRISDRGRQFGGRPCCRRRCRVRAGCMRKRCSRAAAQGVCAAARRARARHRRSRSLTRAALAAAEFVVALSPFRSAAERHADVQLPVAPFTETAGTFVNCEGRAQAFAGAAPPLGDTRPAWKVLRVLGSMLGLPGFDFDSIDAVRAELPAGDASIAAPRADQLRRVSRSSLCRPRRRRPRAHRRRADLLDDPLVRRAPSLQKTRDAQSAWRAHQSGDADHARP